MLGGTFFLDVISFLVIYHEIDALMRKGLAIGTRKYEHEQNCRVLKGEERSYPIWDEFIAEAEWNFLANMAEKVLESACWNVLPEPVDEEYQMFLYIQCSRCASLCYMLCVKIQTWFPFLTYDALRSDASLRRLLGLPQCVKDPYSVNVVDYSIRFAIPHQPIRWKFPV